MPTVQVKEITSRLGNFCLIKIDDAVLLTPCDTRMKIITSLAQGERTADELAQATSAAYSTIMDHMDVLERAGIITAFLKREGGKRRIYFKLAEKPGEQFEKIPV